jgi:hypothetical protein
VSGAGAASARFPAPFLLICLALDIEVDTFVA